MKRSVILSCGHYNLVDHTKGERLIHCSICGLDNIVTAREITNIVFEVKPVQEPLFREEMGG